MSIEDQLRERLRKVEALFFGAATEGEREAAGAAAERLKAKLDEADATGRTQVRHAGSMVGQAVHRALPALWLHSLPLCASARTTVMVKAPRQLFNDVVWRQFCELHDDLWAYLDETTERVIRETIHADAADAEIAPEPLGLT